MTIRMKIKMSLITVGGIIFLKKSINFVAKE